MRGIGGTTVLRLLGRSGQEFIGSLRVRPNGASSPTVKEGSLAGAVSSMTYGATGLITINFVSGFSFKAGEFPVIYASNRCADNTATHRYQVHLVGDWDNTNRRIVVQCRQEATAFQVPSNAGNWIDLFFQGKG